MNNEEKLYQEYLKYKKNISNTKENEHLEILNIEEQKSLIIDFILWVREIYPKID